MTNMSSLHKRKRARLRFTTAPAVSAALGTVTGRPSKSSITELNMPNWSSFPNTLSDGISMASPTANGCRHNQQADSRNEAFRGILGPQAKCEADEPTDRGDERTVRVA